MNRLCFLQERSSEAELMDNHDCDCAMLHTTLRQFTLLNSLFSASRFYIRTYFFSRMMHNKKKEYTLLDLGAGACDIDIWMMKEAKKRGILLRITALDSDARVLPVAQKAIELYPEITLVTGNALDLSSLGTFDFVFSNHMLHHLAWDEISIVMKQVLQHTTMAFCLNDLKRSYGAYMGYTVFTSLFVRNSFALYDGRLSIKRGFTGDEWQEFLQTHFPDNAISVVPAHPSRLALVKVLPPEQ